MTTFYIHQCPKVTPMLSSKTEQAIRLISLSYCFNLFTLTSGDFLTLIGSPLKPLLNVLLFTKVSEKKKSSQTLTDVSLSDVCSCRGRSLFAQTPSEKTFVVFVHTK